MMVIFVVEYQDFITGRIIQHGFALSLAKAEEECEALYRRCGGNRLDYWVQSYIVKDGEYTTFD
jgi:hypothetical protein